MGLHQLENNRHDQVSAAHRTLLASANHSVEDITSCRICHDKTFQPKSTSFQRQKLPKLESSLVHDQSLIKRQLLQWCINYCKSGQQGIQKWPGFPKFISIKISRPGALCQQSAEFGGSNLSTLCGETM